MPITFKTRKTAGLAVTVAALTCVAAGFALSVVVARKRMSLRTRLRNTAVDWLSETAFRVVGRGLREIGSSKDASNKVIRMPSASAG